MKFDTRSDGGSYEKPAVGKYIGVLIGFAYVGTQPGGNFGPKAKVMLRWELHKRRGPSLDSKNFVHTISATYGATVKGDQSLLRKCLEAHGIDFSGSEADSEEWLGHAAWLDLEESKDGKWVNVAGVSRLDPVDDRAPTPLLPFEHWEPGDEATCPFWCGWAVARSTDFSHLAPPKLGQSNGHTGTGAAGVASTAGSDDEGDDSGIPF